MGRCSSFPFGQADRVNRGDFLTTFDLDIRVVLYQPEPLLIRRGEEGGGGVCELPYVDFDVTIGSPLRCRQWRYKGLRLSFCFAHQSRVSEFHFWRKASF